MRLALDTSTVWSSIALLDGVQVLAERDLVGVNPGEAVVDTIDTLVGEVGVPRAEIAGIDVGVGPGPYTSTRVGVAIARTLGFALDIEVVGVCSHDAVAAEVAAQDGIVGDEFIVATDARRSEIYWARYSPAGVRVWGPTVGKPATVAEQTAAALWFGNGLDRHPAVVQEHELKVNEPTHPRARWISSVAAHARDAGASVPTAQPGLADHESGVEVGVDAGQMLFAPYPLYLRRPDAVPAAHLRST